MEQPFPESSDPLVCALQRLLSKYGRKQVALAIGANDQSLYQIATGKTDSKTGRPKSVGRRLRERLDEAFPGWLAEEEPSGETSERQPNQSDATPAAIASVLEALRVSAEAVPPELREVLARLVADYITAPPERKDILKDAIVRLRGGESQNGTA